MNEEIYILGVLTTTCFWVRLMNLVWVTMALVSLVRHDEKSFARINAFASHYILYANVHHM